MMTTNHDKLGNKEIEFLNLFMFATWWHVNLWYFKLRFDLTEFIVWNISKVYNIGLQRYRDYICGQHLIYVYSL